MDFISGSLFNMKLPVFSRKALLINFIILLLLLSAAVLRFTNLGYSNYHGDEHKAFIELDHGQNVFSFFMEQRKGPLQFVVTLLPYLITQDYHNEFAERLPFAIISTFSVLVFYLLIKKMTANSLVALFAGFLYAFNGFFVGFGRIAQYQNLNLLFSFLAIYYFYDLIGEDTKIYTKSAIKGVLFFGLSFLAHWDAIFITPLVGYFLLRFILNKEIDALTKKQTILNTLIVGGVVLLPFMVPYVISQLFNAPNQAYFQRRIGIVETNVQHFKFLIELYNPYITFWYISVLSVLGLLNIKKALPFVVWFIPTFLVFLIFFRKPGTHIYNFVLPCIALAGLGVDLLTKLMPKKISWALWSLTYFFAAFFFYQSYRYFVDHSKEYPWEQKALIEVKKPLNYNEIKGLKKYIYDFLTKETPIYTTDQKLPLFGFPHYRYWDEINAFVNSQNKVLGTAYTYITNEDKVISDWYMDTKYGSTGGFYIVGIKKPTNFVADWSFPQYSKRTKLREFGNKEAVVRIYRVDRTK